MTPEQKKPNTKTVKTMDKANNTGEWVSVKDEKPEYCKDVAVLVEWHTGKGELSDELQLSSGYISYRDRWLLNMPMEENMFATIAGFRVVYWMPLPSPPNK